MVTTLLLCTHVSAQQDSKKILSGQNLFDTSGKNLGNGLLDSTAKPLPGTDSVIFKPKHDPRKATLRSAIIPGWGQAYNHEYWKIPLVYGALAIPTATFIYNNTWYKKTRYAYTVVVTLDTANYKNIDPKLQGLIGDPQDLQHYRNSFRKNRDYSALWFLIVWGLNIADATVFGHLRDFDISDNLSLHLQPSYNPLTKTANMGLVFNFRTPDHKMIPAE